MRKLTHKEEAFANEVVRLGVQTEAYRVAYKPKVGVSAQQIAQMACEIAARPRVAARIKELKDLVVEDVLMDAKAVVRHLAEIAVADHNELTQYRRVNCRYCNGIEHKYQWKHKGEFEYAYDQWEEAKEAHEERQRKATAKTRFKKPEPNDEGGYGFKANAEPHPKCPECLGEGIEEMFVADTRKLTGPAKRLYAGVKMTKNGIEVLTRSQDSALKMLGDHFGVFKTVIEAHVTSENNNNNTNVDLTLDDLRELARKKGLPENIFDKRK